MTINQETRPYEILIRLHADGTVGAHRKTITEIFSDGEIISAKENDAEPLATAEGRDLEVVSKVLGDAVVTVIARSELLQKENADLLSERSEINDELQNAKATIEDNVRSMAALERQLAGYRQFLEHAGVTSPNVDGEG